jgi:hypothetical protein
LNLLENFKSKIIRFYCWKKNIKTKLKNAWTRMKIIDLKNVRLTNKKEAFKIYSFKNKF